MVKDVLDELPDAYYPVTWERKADIVFNHIFASYYDDGHSVYDEGAVLVGAPPPAAAVATPVPASIDVETVSRTVVDQIKSDPGFAELVAEQLRGEKAFFAVPSQELIAGDETYEVEFKATARWNLREQRKDRRMEMQWSRPSRASSTPMAARSSSASATIGGRSVCPRTS